MAVVPVGAGLADRETVGEGLAGLDAVEIHHRDAVHAGRHHDAVPMDGGLLLEAVDDVDRHLLALLPAQRRSGDLAVDGEYAARLALDLHIGAVDDELVGSGEPRERHREREGERRVDQGFHRHLPHFTNRMAPFMPSSWWPGMLHANSRSGVRAKVHTKLAVLPGSTQTPPSCAMSAIEWPAWPAFFITSIIAFICWRCSACSGTVPMVSSCGSLPSLRTTKRTISPSRTSRALSEKALSMATTSMVRVTLAGSPGRPPLGAGPWADAGAAIANARTPTSALLINMKLLPYRDASGRVRGLSAACAPVKARRGRGRGPIASAMGG